MKRILVLLSVLILPVKVLAQEAVPAGTVLPVQLNSSLSRKTKPGQVITARVMQDVSLGDGSRIRAGAKVTGQVIDVTPRSFGASASISITFNELLMSHRKLGLVTDLRALASPMEVEDAQIPDMGGDRGTPSTAYTTNQVGGDEVVYRGGGHVMNGSRIVGEPVGDGVVGEVSPNAAGECRGAIEGNDRPQSLWVFSSDACGVYGFHGVTIAHAGRTDPVGRITLTSSDGDLNIRAGSGLLLRVVASVKSRADRRGSYSDACCSRPGSAYSEYKLVPTRIEKESVLMTHATGAFDVKLTPVPFDDKPGDAGIGRMLIDKQFHGDLEATSRGQMLSAGTGGKGSSGGYVALERVTGKLNGREGSFVLQHSATMTRGTPQLSITVVPDSGTGQLVGLAGTFTIKIDTGKHSYDFEYTLAETP
jgi:hypothetical protein